MPPWTRGWSVFTRPSSISGKPVTAATSVTGRPASRSARAVPPVETSSKPRATRPAAKAARPGLVGDRQQRPARRRASPPRRRPASIVTRRPSTASAPASSSADGPRQEPVLDRVEALEQRLLGVVAEDRDRLGQHDRAAVERRVDEVDRDAGHRHAGRQRVADRVGAGERGQERRVDVEDAAGERVEEGRPDEAHVAGQDDRVDAQRLQRLGQGPRRRAARVAGLARAEVRR